MDNCATEQDYSTLAMKRVFDADIETVFSAWTQAEWLQQWFGPEGIKTDRVNVDLRPGGQYEIILLDGGKEIRHFGEYVLINHPHQLVFTWILNGQECASEGPDVIETLVTIDFRQVGDATEITLLHERLPGKKSYEGHHFGWSGCLDTLETKLG